MTPKPRNRIALMLMAGTVFAGCAGAPAALPKPKEQNQQEGKQAGPPRTPPKIAAGFEDGWFRSIPDGWVEFEATPDEQQKWKYVRLYDQDRVLLPEVWILRPDSGIPCEQYCEVKLPADGSIFWHTFGDVSHQVFFRWLQLGTATRMDAGFAPKEPTTWIEYRPEGDS